ncbi:MAG TPA: sigma-E factor negative regulatory protein [Steroidobacteraceae bacterium]|jgi:negative regulator of sigma E activity|nr:sigma-E factor negative regulatory protein [Steroidobacteraceae bacterium]
MNDERPPNDKGAQQGERDSQLSAMFDGELSAAECELLARRLSRDEALRAQWSRYALMGAALRAERGVKLHDRVARRVQAQIALEVSYGDVAAVDSGPSRAAATQPARPAAASDRWLRVARPVFGAGIAAGVAAMSILWLRGQESPEILLASAPLPEAATLTPEPVSSTVTVNQPAPAENRPSGNGEPFRYTTPVPSGQHSVAPPARLANYVVAHSEYSGPLSRRLALLGLVASDGTADGTMPADDPQADPEIRSDAH